MSHPCSVTQESLSHYQGEMSHPVVLFKNHCQGETSHPCNVTQESLSRCQGEMSHPCSVIQESLCLTVRVK